MIIGCPQCGTKYRLADHLIRPDGNKVRCSNCRFVFFCPSPAQNDPQTQAESRSGFESSGPDTAQPLPKDAPFPQKRVPRKRGSFFLLLFFILVLAVAAYLYYPDLKTWLPFLSQSSTVTELSRKTEDGLNDLSQIDFTDVRQYMVDNEKIGRLLIIEGKAINASPNPVEMIKVQAEIFDKTGQGLQRKAFLCGNTLSLFQLQVLDRNEMEKALASRVGVLTNNTNLLRDQEVSFMTVFSNPPPEMAEFSLKVLQAKPSSQD